jgi:hypothetical protein
MKKMEAKLEEEMKKSLAQVELEKAEINDSSAKYENEVK